MVNRGRPSRGCQNCKARRIKCDETRPQCYKCTSTGRTCPGVPDDFDLVLRDQTQSTSQKSRRSTSATPSRAISARRSPRPSPQLHSPNVSPTLPTRSRASSVQRQRSAHRQTPQLSSRTSQQALSAFLLSHQPFISEGIHPIYSDSSASSVLHQAVEALSLISFSNHFPTHCLRDKAVAAYAQALHGLNAAITDPEQSRADSTLLAIFLLCMYEMSEGGATSVNSYANYTRHLDGAVAVLRHRGELQFQDQTSLRLFQAARMQMIHTYAIHSRAIPNFAPNKDWLCDAEDLEAFPNSVVKLSLKVATMRAQAQSLFTSASVEPLAVSELLEQSMGVDSEASSRYTALPDTWRPMLLPCYCKEHVNCSVEDPCPSDVPVEESNIWLGNPVIHVYSSMSTAHHVLNYQIVRLFANALIMRCLRWFAEQGLDVDGKEGYEQAQGHLQEVVNDICCCIPYHMEHALLAPRAQDAEEAPATTGFTAKQGAYLILTPLYLATLVETIPNVQRAWLRNQLKRLSRDRGLKQAEVLCNAQPCMIAGDIPPQPGSSGEETV